MKELEFTYEEFEDGSLVATMNLCPSGNVYAINQNVLAAGMKHIIDAMEKAKKSGKERGILDLAMNGQWIEGRFFVRFLRVPGFGIDFDDEQGIREWLLAFEQGQGKVSA